MNLPTHFRDHKGEMQPAPALIGEPIATSTNGMVVLAKKSNRSFQVRYGLQSTPHSNLPSALQDFQACFLHMVACGID